MEVLLELSKAEQVGLGILLTAVLYIIFAPWLSLTHLSKLNDIAYELKRIRELLEKRDE